MVEHCRPTRRTFLEATAGAATVGVWYLATGGAPARAEQGSEPGAAAVPSYLAGYEAEYRADPRGAALKWFREARFGLFLHYGLYSILGRHEWVQWREQIPLAEYARLKEQFTAEKFDADFITDLALAAEMKYVNLTTRHHEGFCLFRTKETDYSSADAPAKRDLVGELARACRSKGLGFFCYYSYALDWRHPYFFPREAGWDRAHPAYANPEPAYKWEKDEDFQHYIRFVHAQLRELLTQYGPVAGIWFDPIRAYYARPDLFPIRETYALIRSLQPQVLLSFKQGATGDEDFIAPERSAHSLADAVRKNFPDKPASIEAAERAWERNKDKPREICDTLQLRGWGYVKDERHRDADWVMGQLAAAASQNANLLLNTGPLPDGSIHPDDVRTLREVGRRLRTDGWPKA